MPLFIVYLSNCAVNSVLLGRARERYLPLARYAYRSLVQSPIVYIPSSRRFTMTGDLAVASPTAETAPSSTGKYILFFISSGGWGKIKL